MSLNYARNVVLGDKGLSEHEVLDQRTPRRNICEEDTVLKNFGDLFGGKGLNLDILDNRTFDSARGGPTSKGYFLELCYGRWRRIG